MKYFSTFTGVGGFEIAMHNAIPDAICVGYSEVEKHANMIMKYKYPEAKNYGDITRINAEELPDFDLLCGGFPCQTFSIAGKRLGFNDTRGTLFYEIARIIKIKRPSILLLENVKGLLNHEEGKTFKVIIATLDELGYDAEWELLNSKYFGVPQNRERVYIVGRLRGKPWSAVFPITRTDNEADASGNGEKPRLQQLNEESSQGYRVYDPEGISQTLASGAGGMGAKTGLYMVNDPSRKQGIVDKNESPTLRSEAHGNLPAIVVDSLEKNKPRWGDHYKTPEDISPTLMAIGKTDVAHVVVHSLQTRNPDKPSLKLNPHAGGSGHIMKEDETYCLDTGNTQAIQEGLRIRRLTPRECERLQGFPDDWTKYGINEEGEQVEISDNQRYARMGNAVTTNVAEAILKRLYNNGI